MNRKSLLALALTLSILLISCGVDRPDPAAPSLEGTPAIPIGNGNYTSVIGSTGGTLSGDTAELIVPSGALSTSTSLTMVTSVVAGLNHCDLTPNGQQFAATCTLKIQKPLPAGPNDVYHIFWYDDSISDWVDIGGTTSGAWITTGIDHFSSYKADLAQ